MSLFRHDPSWVRTVIVVIPPVAGPDTYVTLWTRDVGYEPYDLTVQRLGDVYPLVSFATALRLMRRHAPRFATAFSDLYALEDLIIGRDTGR